MSRGIYKTDYNALHLLNTTFNYYKLSINKVQILAVAEIP